MKPNGHRLRPPGDATWGRRRSLQAFNLLGFLLVGFVVSSVLITYDAIFQPPDDAAMREVTLRKMAEIRRGILGQERMAVDGNAMVSGFWADVGRPPASMNELFFRGAIPAWSMDPVTRLWSGWRGPYLLADLRATNVVEFLDGWRNSGGSSFGWSFFSTNLPATAIATNLAVRFTSLGSDGLADGPVYPGDERSDLTNIIYASDATFPLRSWTVNLVFTNPALIGTSAITLSNLFVNPVTTNYRVRLRLHYPQEGSYAWMGTNWPTPSLVRDGTVWLSSANNLAAVSPVPNGGSRTRGISFPASHRNIPAGVRAITVVRDEDGRPFGRTGQVMRVYMPPGQSVAPDQTFLWFLE